MQDARPGDDDILKAAIGRILQQGKDRNALARFVVDEFSLATEQAEALADRALSIHALVVDATASLAKGAAPTSVNRTLIDAGMSAELAESVVAAGTQALAETRARVWKTELKIALACTGVGLALTTVTKNVIFMAFCVLGAYYAARSAWHVARRMQARR
jgi:hypothetical protein